MVSSDKRKKSTYIFILFEERFQSEDDGKGPPSAAPEVGAWSKECCSKRIMFTFFFYISSVFVNVKNNLYFHFFFALKRKLKTVSKKFRNFLLLRKTRYKNERVFPIF